MLLGRARDWAAAVGPLVDEPTTFPLLMVWADMPRLSAWHAEAPLGDLAAGADLAIGPTLDGGVYLVALAAPHPDVVDTALAADSPPLSAAVLAAAGAAGLEAGLLRPERAVRTDGDRRALLADPLLAPDVRAALEGAG